ncbi:Hypothetical protein A7982_03529 [Minicystis rosea]|nr:Hypothetical protein A7982_03529 [Minicystis rosea]
MMNLRALALGSLVALAAPACAGSDPAPEAVDTADSAATATRIYASEADLDLSFETLGTFEDRDGSRALILHATANRYLESVYSFIPDDLFGEAHIISERRLEVVIHEGYELNTLLSGMPLFVAVNTFTGTPNHYTARVDIAARFYDFLGSSSIFIDEKVDPYYVLNGSDNLVYRGSVDALATQMTVTAPDGAPTVAQADADTFRLDWPYAGLHDAIDPHTQYLTFTAALNSGVTAKKTTRLVARVVGLALTSGDAYDVWPAPVCQPDVYTCYHAQPAGTTDFSACGSYREVLACTYANVCNVVQFPLSLTPVDASALEPARATYNGEPNGYAWRELSSLAAFSTPGCPEAPVTIQSILAKLEETNQSQPPATDGTFTNRAGLSQSSFFGTGDADGAALLAAIDAFTGGGDVQAWIYSSPVPCLNCHDFASRVVLYYPGSGQVITLVGHHGYDS